jgi:UPF0716 protein FxsA
LRLGKRIAIALVALPLAELAVFALISMAIGVTAALALTIATSIVGGLVLRDVGRDGLAHLRAAVGDPAMAGERNAAPDWIRGLAGILLVLPGFITDVGGLVLLLPPLRRAIAAKIAAWLSAAQRTDGRPAVIDLDSTEWHQISETKPRRRPTKTGPS